MTNSEKRLIVQANKIPFPKIINCPDKRGLIVCPFRERHAHGDQNKSAFYYNETNLIHCFTFHNTWSPVSLLAEKTGCSKLIAAKYLLKKFGEAEEEVRLRNPKIDTSVFATLKANKWEDLLMSVEGEPALAGVVNFISSMKFESECMAIDMIDMVTEDALKIQEMIEEGRSCE